MLVLCCLAPALPAGAERAPVLKQIAVPHDYYVREMYLPQTTTGPHAPAFTPDGETLVYSMGGSLWRQALDSTEAVQLTAGPGYDYQPDVSPDGGRVAFVRYDGDAMELQVLDLQSGRVSPLTHGGAVNLEPRWSPDGTRLAFASTRDTGRFRLFVGEVQGGSLDAAPVFAERDSSVERYYYSRFDHQLSPSWSPDGRELMYVGNPGTPYGTGELLRYELDAADAEPRLVRREETSWRARPDWSPDGRRYVYASYLGRQWHQLWGGAVEGRAEPFPLTYGEHDVFAPRWSPDGRRIAYVTNEGGNTSLRVMETVGGETRAVRVEARVYLYPVGELRVRVRTGGGGTAARLAVEGADGRAYAPADAWMHADDGYDRELQRFETRYFHAEGSALLTVPAGPARVTAWRGLEHRVASRLVTVRSGERSEITIDLEDLDPPRAWQGWTSGDVHVHMNYGGTYRNTPERMVRQAATEDLGLVFNLIVNKEQRIPDIAYFSTDPDPASDDAVTLLHAQEFHTSYWGHMGLLGLDRHYLMPDYSAYPYTWAASLYPDNATVAELAHAQNAAVGYVHPFLAPPPDPNTDESLTNALPVDVALGHVDYYEVVGFADHRASAEVWYRLLNLGFRVAAAGGTDAMANYASLRGPVGINRTYVPVAEGLDPAARRDAWLAGLKAGRSIATNGPLLGLAVAGRGPGEEVELAGERELEYSGFMRSIVPIEHLELVHNSEVIERIELSGERRRADFAGRVRVDGSGWIVLRAWSSGSHPLVFDLYPYGTTSPVYLADGAGPRSAEDAEYFMAWIDRIEASAAAHADYNSDEERRAVLDNLDRARRVFEDRR